jgi:hypothetical protein
VKVHRSIGGVFCDDIRQEVHGKISLIGCYSGSMLVAEFPVTLPKLCAHVRLITPAEQPFKDVKFIILRDDDVLLEAEMPTQEVEAFTDLEKSGTALRDIYAQFVISPIELMGPCTLRVRAITDGIELRGLALNVDLANSAQLAGLVLPAPVHSEESRSD